MMEDMDENMNSLTSGDIPPSHSSDPAPTDSLSPAPLPLASPPATMASTDSVTSKLSVHVGSSVAANKMDWTGRELIVVEHGRLHPSSKCSSRISSIFIKRIDPSGFSWKMISQATKQFYWEKFKKYFFWEDGVEALLKHAWQLQACIQYSEMLSKWRRTGKPQYVSQEIWAKWQQEWHTPEFGTRRQAFSTNQCSETAGGPGLGPSRHIGGSISLIESSQIAAKELVRDLTPYGGLQKKHSRKSDENQFVDQLPEKINDWGGSKDVVSVSQAEKLSTKSAEINKKQLHMETVGKTKKQRVNSNESQGSIFYSSSRISSSAHYTSSLMVQLRAEVREELLVEVRKENMEQVIRQELHEKTQDVEKYLETIKKTMEEYLKKIDEANKKMMVGECRKLEEQFQKRVKEQVDKKMKEMEERMQQPITDALDTSHPSALPLISDPAPSGAPEE